MEQRSEREKAAKEMKDDMKTAVEFRKEVMALRKYDQLENINRWKAFSKLYTSKLAEKIVEKNQRVEHLQNEQ